MVDGGDDVHPLVVVDETLSLVRLHGCTIDVALNVMRDTFAHAVGDVASLAQATMLALRDAGFDDLYLPARHLSSLELADPEIGVGKERHVATYQFGIAVSDLAAVSEVLTTVASVELDLTPPEDTALPPSDAIPLEIDTRTDVVDLVKARAQRLAGDGVPSRRNGVTADRATFRSLGRLSVVPKHRDSHLPLSST